MRGRIAAILMLAVALTGCQTSRSVYRYFAGTPSTFIVFFASGSAELTPDAAAIVRDAATIINRTHPASVIIAAGTQAGMGLSQPRFAAVRQALIDDGVGEDVIARSAIADPKLDIAPARQRVEIRLVKKGA